MNTDDCNNEPIHIPGAIQPHGVLLVCRESDLEVTQLSANVAKLLGKTPEAVLGRSATSIFDELSRSRFAAAASQAELRTVNPLRLVCSDGRQLEGVLHRPPNGAGLIVIELEPIFDERDGGAGPSFDPRMRSAILRLQVAHDLPSLTQVAANEVRSLTGFDRVMVYEFDADWNGAVVAEAKRNDLDSFLGQHYPASDIPVQARRLYELNWLRLIGDVSYEPVPMLASAEFPPLDMTYAVLRSVSPIHIEYLKNMGVSASMSISLIHEGRLSGLIACHHYSGPHVVNFTIRETVQYLGQALSWHGNVLRLAERSERARSTQEHEAAIMRSVATEPELLDGLGTPSLVSLANASGAAIVLNDGVRTVGRVPSSEQIAIIATFLAALEGDIFASNKLSDHIAEAAEWEDVAAGLLAVPIARELGEYLLWFRPSSERVINWAGNPNHEKLTNSAGAHRLSPRGSFALWREIVHGQSEAWARWEVDGASSLRRLLLSGVRRRASELHVLNARLNDADRAKDNFIATVSHELRTPLNTISGWAHLLSGGGLSKKQTQRAIGIISRNVQIQSQLVEDLLDVSRMTSGKLKFDIESVVLLEIVQSSLENAALAASARAIDLVSNLARDMPPILGDPGRLRQVVENLLSNAIKFTPTGGTVRVTLRRIAADLELLVEDSGRGISAEFLPHIFEPFRQEDAGMNRRSHGLGLGLAIVRKIVELHGGTVSAQSDGDDQGSQFLVRLPSGAPVSFLQSEPPPPRTLPLDAPAELAKLRVLFVEDDTDTRELLKHVLETCGTFVTAAADARAALTLLDEDASRFDVILSDIGLPELDGLAFMRLVRERDVEKGGRLPAVALSAYTRAVDRTQALQAGFQAHVPKPVDPHELVATLASLVRRE